MKDEEDTRTKQDFIRKQIESSKKLLKEYIKFKDKEEEKRNDSSNRR